MDLSPSPRGRPGGWGLGGWATSGVVLAWVFASTAAAQLPHRLMSGGGDLACIRADCDVCSDGQCIDFLVDGTNVGLCRLGDEPVNEMVLCCDCADGVCSACPDGTTCTAIDGTGLSLCLGNVELCEATPHYLNACFTKPPDATGAAGAPTLSWFEGDCDTDGVPNGVDGCPCEEGLLDRDGCPIPEPDAGATEPDGGPTVPDAGAAEPDAGEPSEPEPDAAAPQADGGGAEGPSRTNPGINGDGGCAVGGPPTRIGFWLVVAMLFVRRRRRWR